MVGHFVVGRLCWITKHVSAIKQSKILSLRRLKAKVLSTPGQEEGCKTVRQVSEEECTMILDIWVSCIEKLTGNASAQC